MTLRFGAAPFAAATLALLLTPPLSEGQVSRTDGPESLSEVLEDLDEDRIPDRLGDTVWVEGVLTIDPFSAAAGHHHTYLQDPTAGIRLVSSSHGPLAGVARDDAVHAVGVLLNDHGSRALDLISLVRTRPGFPPTPIDVPAVDALGGGYEGRVVRLRGVLRIGDAPVLADSTGSVAIHLSGAIFPHREFPWGLEDGRAAQVVGIAEPFDSGYRILLRDVTGVHMDPVPPDYRLVLLTALVAALIMLVLWQRQQEAARRAGEAARVLEAQRTFLMDMSHHLRTPVAVIRGDLEVALRRERSNQEYQALVERSLEGLEVVSTLADDLMTLARTESGATELQLEDWGAHDLVSHVWIRFEHAAGRAGCILAVDEIPRVALRCDGLLVQRALGNLVDNALKYGDPGVVSLRVRRRNGGWVALEVANPGAISQEELDRLGQRFRRGPRTERIMGHGLGLAIARAVAERHGGRLEAESRAGVTTVRLVFPADVVRELPSSDPTGSSPDSDPQS